MARLAALLVLLSTGCHTSVRDTARPPGGDVENEATALLSEYLRIDTTNPPGNEMRAALFLKRALERDGIEAQVFDLGAGRANLVAVLRGDGSRRPVILHHHMDVVRAEASHWRHPPFSGKVVAGEVWGRGAVDMKGKAIIDVVTMLRLKRRGIRLHRDVVLVAVADEEVGSLGTKWLLRNRPDLVHGAEFLLDEGASLRRDASGSRVTYLISIAEKAPLWLRATFTGRPGHSSLPTKDNAVARAVRAASRILEHRPAPRLMPELRPWLRMRLAERDLSRLPGYAGDLDAALDRGEFLEAVSDLEPELNASLRDTVALTGLRGSEQVNTIPNDASLLLDCRLLPGTRPKQLIAELVRLMREPGVRIDVLESYETRASPAGSELVLALRRVAARHHLSAEVIPTLLLSSTDSAYYRAIGIQAYGFEPYLLTDAEAELSHSNDERLSTRNLALGVQLLTELLLEIDGPRRAGEGRE